MRFRARKDGEDVRFMCLEENDEGGVTLYVEDPDFPGEPWAVLSITKKGTCVLHEGLSGRSGLQISAKGRVSLELD